jgi:pimeloyl-ACP methyl ester carboxylesterase
VKAGWNEIELNGARQWVSLRGDPGEPILLFLHGGPGGAEYGPRRHYLGGLERQWRVVDWDQRGAGRSFRGDESPTTLSIDALVADALALVDRLREAHPGRPLVLAGHSFGTVLGVLVASRAPERLAAYVGASQVVDWADQEARSYEWVLGEARRLGNVKAVAALEAIGRPVEGVYASGTRGAETQRRWLGSLGGVSGEPGFLTRWVSTILLQWDYPLGAKLRFSKGMRRSMDIVWPELGQRIVFSRDVAALTVPVHLFAGDRDRITTVEQLRPWYEALKAPSKRLEVVEGVGHLNLFEAPGRFETFMADVRRTIDS